MLDMSEITLANNVFLVELAGFLVKSGVISPMDRQTIFENAAKKLESAPETSTAANANAARFLREIAASFRS
jgi:hypothetical protein